MKNNLCDIPSSWRKKTLFELTIIQSNVFSKRIKTIQHIKVKWYNNADVNVFSFHLHKNDKLFQKNMSMHAYLILMYEPKHSYKKYKIVSSDVTVDS